jgi:hypothetical protein
VSREDTTPPQQGQGQEDDNEPYQPVVTLSGQAHDHSDSSPQGSTKEGQGPQQVWSEAQHRFFVAALFDLGMKHSSPSTIMEHMALAADLMSDNNMKEEEDTSYEQRNTPLLPPDKQPAPKSLSGLTSERVKSKLQKYRLNKDKSRTEFMTSYDKTVTKLILTHSTSSTAGSAAAAANNAASSYAVFKTSALASGNKASATTAALLSLKPSNSQTAPAVPHLAEGGEIAAYLAFGTMVGGDFISSGKVGGYEHSVGVGAPPTTGDSSSESGSQNKASNLQISMPKLTAEETQSPLGSTMGYLKGLFFVLRQQLLQHRIEEMAFLKKEELSPTCENEAPMTTHNEQSISDYTAAPPAATAARNNVATPVTVSCHAHSEVPPLSQHPQATQSQQQQHSRHEQYQQPHPHPHAETLQQQLAHPPVTHAHAAPPSQLQSQAHHHQPPSLSSNTAPTMNTTSLFSRASSGSKGPMPTHGLAAHHSKAAAASSLDESHKMRMEMLEQMAVQTKMRELKQKEIYKYTHSGGGQQQQQHQQQQQQQPQQQVNRGPGADQAMQLSAASQHNNHDQSNVPRQITVQAQPPPPPSIPQSSIHQIGMQPLSSQGQGQGQAHGPGPAPPQHQPQPQYYAYPVQQSHAQGAGPPGAPHQYTVSFHPVPPMAARAAAVGQQHHDHLHAAPPPPQQLYHQHHHPQQPQQHQHQQQQQPQHPHQQHHQQQYLVNFDPIPVSDPASTTSHNHHPPPSSLRQSPSLSSDAGVGVGAGHHHVVPSSNTNNVCLSHYDDQHHQRSSYAPQEREQGQHHEQEQHQSQPTPLPPAPTSPGRGLPPLPTRRRHTSTDNIGGDAADGDQKSAVSSSEPAVSLSLVSTLNQRPRGLSEAVSEEDFFWMGNDSVDDTQLFQFLLDTDEGAQPNTTDAAGGGSGDPEERQQLKTAA